jgi:hypothetical protein
VNQLLHNSHLHKLSQQPNQNLQDNLSLLLNHNLQLRLNQLQAH